MRSRSTVAYLPDLHTCEFPCTLERLLCRCVLPVQFRRCLLLPRCQAPRWDYATVYTGTTTTCSGILWLPVTGLRSSACFEALPVPAPACVPPSFIRVKLVEEAGSSTHRRQFVGTRMLMLTGCATRMCTRVDGMNQLEPCKLFELSARLQACKGLQSCKP